MRQMRKAGRRKDEKWAFEVFDKAPFVTVSMTRPDGTPYGLPLNIVRKDETTFYFHCAAEGEKIDCLNFDEAIMRSLDRTTVVRITLTEPPIGKSKP